MKARSDVCYSWQLKKDSRSKLLQENDNEINGKEIIGYVPEGDLAKSSNVKNSKIPTATQELKTNQNGEEKGLKVDLEKKNRQEVKDQLDKQKANPSGDFVKNIGHPADNSEQDESTGGKYADRIAEEERREMLTKSMANEQIQEEDKTSFFKDAPIFELRSNSQINNVINWVELPTKKYKAKNGQQGEIKMGGNATHQNLLVVYHPQCKHCNDMKEEFAKLSQLVQEKKVPLNVLSVNDGIPGYKKFLPGNLKIEYYPYILFLKNDKD